MCYFNDGEQKFRHIKTMVFFQIYTTLQANSNIDVISYAKIYNNLIHDRSFS